MSKIYLAPIQFGNLTFLKSLFSELNKIFQNKVEILDLNIDVDSAYSKDRSQYYSTKLIASAIELTKEIEGKIILLVEFDLYVPVFTYVYGEAQLNGKHSIVSLCRLHEEFYTGVTDDTSLMSRAIKEILHELGHNFGLHHCKDWGCVMHMAGIIEEVDIKGSTFCSECISKVPDFNLNLIPTL